MAQNKGPSRRSESDGLLHFGKEMTSALLMALVFIVYVIQAFRIPTGSMEKSLLVGDFLLGLKFVYGAPILPFVTTKKFPGITNPKPGDVIIFKYPGSDSKDYIKRCVAGPGQTIESHGTTLTIDGKVFKLPPNGQYIRGGDLPWVGVRDFAPLRVPRKGDTLHLDSLPVREFLFARNLIHQENPRDRVRAEYQLYVGGEFADNLSFEGIDDWTRIDQRLEYVRGQAGAAAPGKDIGIRQLLYLKNQRVRDYLVKYDNYFMMGDNRDNSTDSRFWGYLNRNFVKAKAFILYFSWDKEPPLWMLPAKIRWNRIGKLIRPWDGTKM